MHKREVRDAAELPVTQSASRITMSQRCCAHQPWQRCSVRVSGPTLVGKYLSDGARMVHDMSRLAREKASSFVFIDEVDAVAAQRHRVREPTAR